MRREAEVVHLPSGQAPPCATPRRQGEGTLFSWMEGGEAAGHHRLNREREQ